MTRQHIDPDRKSIMKSLTRSLICRFSFLIACTCLTVTAAGADEEVKIKQLDVGDRVRNFDLPVVGSQEYLTLSDEYKQGAVVVIVLRGFPGYQCPVCSRQIGSLANRAKAIAKLAHRVILVYPGPAASLERRAKQFKGSRKLPEPLVIVRDDGMEMVDQWGLRWNALKETAYPATYVVDRNGRVRWKKVSRSHAGRSSVEEILKELRKL